MNRNPLQHRPAVLWFWTFALCVLGCIVSLFAQSNNIVRYSGLHVGPHPTFTNTTLVSFNVSGLEAGETYYLWRAFNGSQFWHIEDLVFCTNNSAMPVSAEITNTFWSAMFVVSHSPNEILWDYTEPGWSWATNGGWTNDIPPNP